MPDFNANKEFVQFVSSYVIVLSLLLYFASSGIKQAFFFPLPNLSIQLRFTKQF